MATHKVLLRPPAAASGGASTLHAGVPPAGGAAATPSASSGAAGPSSSSSRGPRKLLNEALELTVDEVAPLLGDSTDFTVVGVLGAQGVGKSTILSLLAGATLADADCGGGGSSGGSSSGGGGGGRGGALLHEPIFPTETPEVALRAAHQTVGADLHVTPERLLLLDTQPLLSPSILLELLQRDASLPADVQNAENLVELHSLRMAMWVLSVCHVVICVQDAQPVQGSLRLLRAAQMLRHRLPDLSSLAHASPAAAAAATASAASATPPSPEDVAASISAAEYQPQLAFVFNRLPETALEASKQQALRSVIARLFAPQAGCTEVSDASRESSPAPPAAVAAAAAAAAAADMMATATPATEAAAAAAAAAALPPAVPPPLLFALPERTAEGLDPFARDHLCAAHRGFAAEAERARDELLALRRPRFAKTITEKEWLRGAQRMWELLRRSALLADFNKGVQKLNLYA